MKRVRDDEVDGDEFGTLLYEGEPFTGEVVEAAPSGQIISLMTYKDGYEDGPWLEWYPDGSPRIEGQNVFGKGAVGRWREWYSNGQLAKDQEFDERGNEISRRQWDEDGNLVEDVMYRK
ncbi:toxin-antitoxin system YwqK family antitoxin [Marinitenerispora sediminis]|uniref:Toxin-antitoxin system YwqK family antitoxin n=1 Tax=Marinitenerispora sediminis TaxID=1931232 RepID=A0A368T0H0_9ACTN|nr:hypothetical protein [Marinitenerispora sediminis]RCV48342.1 hypothetical protein DEF28_23865 [Marinitenerispora sediminis]RCV49519.1 hypothetical protein DEF23_23510 [Marinitenerispora sediminis]RCV52331.1 hypothetical protein DEF24_22155 [Marinitenerispora sediminis]